MKSTLLALALLMGSRQTGTLKIADCTIVPEKGIACPPQPEPIDVPAVHIPAKSHLTYEQHCDEDSMICSGDMMTCSNNGTMVPFDPNDRDHNIAKCKDGYKFGCVDKSRILLTAEDGTRHCVKFSQETR